MTKHIIYKQKVNLRIPPESDAFSLQNRISHLLKNDLSGAIETLFDKISPNGNILRIDKLELNLGSLTESNLETDFTQKFIEQLSRALEKIKVDNTGTKAGEIRQEQSLLASLIYFLDHGHLPWYSTVKDFSVWEDEILQAFSAKEWKSLIAKFKKDVRINDYQIERLTLQFSDFFLQTVLFHIHDGLKKNWEPVYKDIHFILKEFIQYVPQQASRKQYLFWQQAITVALLTKNEKDFVFELLTTILRELRLIRVKKGKEFVPLWDGLLQKLKRIEQNILTEEVLNPLQKLAESIKTATDVKPEESAEAGAESVSESESDTKEKESKRKPGSDEDVLFTENCGIVILHPFLQMYFAELELLDKVHFKDETAKQHAVLLLHYLATGETTVAEMNLLLPKMLCALNFEEPVPNKIDLSVKEKEEYETLLKSVLGHWEPLHGTSIEGLRQTFLQREGKLTPTETGWKLRVEQKTVDILLDKLPWGYSTIKLPWMQDILNVEWC
ncbi:MAG: contractile injection system tape measure protein [Bacteroidales bacterium]|jgi:hypothetical protein